MAATSSFGALPKVRESIGAISPLQDLSPCRVYLSTLAPQYCAGFSKSWDSEDGPAPSHCPGGRTCVCVWWGTCGEIHETRRAKDDNC